MRYKLLGRSGLRVSELCLGTMTFGDNLGVLDFELSAEHLARLAAVHPLELGFPHSFWNDFVRRDLVFGQRVDELEQPEI